MLSRESDKTMTELETAEVTIQRGKTGSSSRRGAPGRAMIVAAAFFCAGFAVLIFTGMRSRRFQPGIAPVGRRLRRAQSSRSVEPLQLSREGGGSL